MIRQTALRQLTLARVRAPQLTAHQPILAAKNYSVLGTAKEVLSKANKKSGEVLAEGMEKVEQVTPTSETITRAAHNVNKKTGEILANGMEKVEPLIPGHGGAKQAGEKVADAAKTVKDKTNEVLADGKKKAEEAVPGKNDLKQAGKKAKKNVKQAGDEIADAADTANKKAGDVLANGMDKAKGAVDEAEAKQRVKQNTKGYKDLQDKGSKVESEQSRPEDGV